MEEEREQTRYEAPEPPGYTGPAAPTQPAPQPYAAPMGPAEPAPGKGAGSGAVTAGVVLIVIGAAFLLGRVVPGMNWWSFWPLIIIVAGMVQAFTPGKEGWSVHRMFDGLVTVSFGMVLLASTTGVVGWGVWARILSLWPVLLIAIGLDLLGKAMGTGWIRVLGSLAIIGALAFAVVPSVRDVDDRFVLQQPSAADDIRLSVPVGGATRANLTLDVGAAEVRMGGSDGALVSLTGSSPWGEPTLDVDRSGETADVTARAGGSEGPFIWPGDVAADFDVGISREVLWDLRVNAGVTNLKADFSDVAVRSIDLRPGVAQCDVRLGVVPPEVSESRAEIRAGVSSVRMRVPSGVEARVEIEQGLSGISVRGDFDEKSGGIWETPGYEAAEAQGRQVWIVAVKSGVGSVTIDTY